MAKRSVSAIVREIKAINARFRKLRNKDGPLADRLRDRKDALIDEMEAICPHPSVIETKGAKAHGPMKRQVAGRRICPRCGMCELDGDDVHVTLRDRKAETLSVDEYSVAQGRILKRLGINI